MQFCFPAPEGSGDNSSSCGIHPRGSSRFRHTAGRIRLLYEEVFRLRGNPPFFPGFIVYHLYGGACDGHSLRAFFLIASKQINQPDTFIFINGHADAFFFAAAVVYGSKVEDFGMQQIFRSLVGRGISSPRISGLCNWHMLFTSSLYINEKRCQ